MRSRLPDVDAGTRFGANVAREVTIARSLLRIAHRIDFMPALAESQTVFAKALAAALLREETGAAVLCYLKVP